MFKRYLYELSWEDRRIVQSEKWKLKYICPLHYLNTQMNSAQEFIDTAYSMLMECDLSVECVDRDYKAKLTIPHGVDDEDEIYGCRTFGYIFKTDFLLDCTMIYERMSETINHHIPRKQEFFNRLFRAGILKHPYLCHPLQYKWFKQYGDGLLLQEDHKFYCVSNSVLDMEFHNFANIS